MDGGLCEDIQDLKPNLYNHSLTRTRILVQTLMQRLPPQVYLMLHSSGTLSLTQGYTQTVLTFIRSYERTELSVSNFKRKLKLTFLTFKLSMSLVNFQNSHNSKGFLKYLYTLTLSIFFVPFQTLWDTPMNQKGESSRV